MKRGNQVTLGYTCAGFQGVWFHSGAKLQNVRSQFEIFGHSVTYMQTLPRELEYSVMSTGDNYELVFKEATLRGERLLIVLG